MRPPFVADHQEKLLYLLDRKTSIDSLGALVSAIGPSSKAVEQLPTIAIGLDSSVFMRLGQQSGADVVDYLDAEHPGPLILPGQAVQEFWNNQLAVVDTISSSVKKKFDALKADVAKIDNTFGDFSERMNALLDEFSSKYGFVYEESTRRTAIKLLETLKRKAIVPYVSRSIFQQIAANRKQTKTPPGFKDDGDGDFFIWADFLQGLLQAKRAGKTFDRAVMITNDQKPDWSRSGTAHPVLVAEVQALVGVAFETWDLPRLIKAIQAR